MSWEEERAGLHLVHSKSVDDSDLRVLGNGLLDEKVISHQVRGSWVALCKHSRYITVMKYSMLTVLTLPVWGDCGWFEKSMERDILGSQVSR
jgi:hypothetical protein